MKKAVAIHPGGENGTLFVDYSSCTVDEIHIYSIFVNARFLISASQSAPKMHCTERRRHSTPGWPHSWTATLVMRCLSNVLYMSSAFSLFIPRILSVLAPPLE